MAEGGGGGSSSAGWQATKDKVHGGPEAAAAAEPLSESQSSQQRQDYRMNLTEVDQSVLETLHEDACLSQNKMTEPVVTAATAPSPPATAVTVAAAAEPMATFHIPESNASVVSAVSEIGSAACDGVGGNEGGFLQLTKTEALSARQQVALWLTRTSMSDLSSMPSLKNIVGHQTNSGHSFTSNSIRHNYYHQHRFGNNKNKQCCSSSKHQKQTDSKLNSPTKKSADTKRKKLIQRNYSTKSLMGGLTFGRLRGKENVPNKSARVEDDEDEEVALSGMRKCETVNAFSGLTSNRSSFGSSLNRNSEPEKQGRSKGHSSAQRGSWASPCNNRSKSSSFSLFRKLGGGGGGGGGGGASTGLCATPKWNPIRGTTCNSSQQGGFPSECYESPYPGIRPTNRLRSTASSMMCSRCSSTAMSIANSRFTSRAPSHVSLFNQAGAASCAGSSRRISLITPNPALPASAGGVALSTAVDDDSASTLAPEDEVEVLCKICLVEYGTNEMVTIGDCGCAFCKECMARYISFEVMAGAYDISCPDQECEKQGVLKINEVEAIAGKEMGEKYMRFRLNTEVALDTNRAWCPRAGCETICHICTPTPGGGNSSAGGKSSQLPVAVYCPSCQKEFCSLCSANWHPGMTCQENGVSQMAAARKRSSQVGVGTSEATSLMVGGDILVLGAEGEIKRCPMCFVPIERDAGCAQMMCKRCKHVFCWFCLTSLDEDFLLRHYDSGECKGRLGHTRASVLWHRAQVIGIFAGFGIMLVVASPLLLLAAPCIFFCDCKHWQYARTTFSGQNGPPPPPSQQESSSLGIENEQSSMIGASSQTVKQ